MRRVDLTNYNVRETCPNCGQPVERAYNVRDSMIQALFSPDLKLNARELLDRDDLARKIRNCPEDCILLEEEEFNKLVQAINSIKGYVSSDVGFVRRVLGSEKVDLQAGSV
jgi:hypothetical protein